VVSPVLRPWLSKAVKHRTEGLAVLSYSEIPDDQSVKVIETVEIASRDGMNE
jgi:flagellar biosynthesis protein FlhA